MLHRCYINPCELQQKRLQANLTQEEVAEALGVHRVTVARWESESGGALRRTTLDQLNSLLGCQLTERFSIGPPTVAKTDIEMPAGATKPSESKQADLALLITKLTESEDVAFDTLEEAGAMLLWLALRKVRKMRKTSESQSLFEKESGVKKERRKGGRRGKKRA